MKKLASIVSIVFDPRIEVPLLLTLAVVTAYSNGAPLRFLALLLFVDAVLPGMFFVHLRNKGEISDMDITKRAERVPLYWFTTLAHLGGVGVAWVFHQDALTRVLLVFWILALIFTVVTTKWKVSVHAGVNVALATYVVLVWGINWWWLYGLVVLVGWSRVKLGRHKMMQVVLGAALGVVGVVVGLGLL